MIIHGHPLRPQSAAMIIDQSGFFTLPSAACYTQHLRDKASTPVHRRAPMRKDRALLLYTTFILGILAILDTSDTVLRILTLHSEILILESNSGLYLKALRR